MRGTLQRIDADVIQVCRAYHVEKQALVTYDPFSVEQRMLTTVSITSEMEALLRAVDAQHIRLVLDAFDGIDWGNLTETQLEARLARIAAILPDRSAMSAGVADLSAYLKREGREVFEATKGGFSNRYNISLEASFNLQDERALANIVDQQAFFVRNSYGLRSEWMSSRARTMVQQGLAEGLSSSAIAQEMRVAIPGSYEARMRGYYDVVSHHFVARAQERGALSLYMDAGVTRVRLVAVQDERTTEWCRSHDGAIIDVRREAAKQNRIDQLANPEDVRYESPWISERLERDAGGIPTGRSVMGAFKAPGQFVPLRYVERPGAGTLSPGRYSPVPGVGQDKIESIGIGFPPYHGRCRSWTELETSRL